ncbi:MAG: hypothetical protein QOH81_2626 [Sphingomonadales bacterium]|jgi:hypothetical protein|nr:hypothetical protein [Sphingomonadales bacterium]
MRIGSFVFPTALRLGRRSVRIGLPLFFFVALSTLLAELTLAERQIPLFGRDFRRFHTLDTPIEILAFLSTLLAAQLFLALLLFWALRKLHGRRGRSPLFYFNYLFLVSTAAAAVLAAKFRVLSYFNEAISFQVIRNLGGGSLVQAFLYVIDDATFLFVGLAFAAILYLLLYRAFGLGRADPPAEESPPRPLFRVLLAVAPLVALLLFEADKAGDARAALDRFVAPYLLYAALDEATDFDRDGYSFFSHQRDAYPFDAGRHPFALDIPDNGIDEDGFAGDFHYRGGDDLLPTPSFPGHRKHVVLLVLESTRADALTARWRGVRIAPNLAALAEHGSSAPEAYSHVGFTRDSLKSLFTGRFEPADDRQSLFRDFKRNGYRIGVISGQAEDFGEIASTVGMRKNSDVFIDAKVVQRPGAWDFRRDISLLLDGRTLLREMDRHFGAHESWRQPTFLYVNIQAAHFPYNFPGTPRFIPGPPIPRSEIRFASRLWVARTYWNAVAYGDWVVGQIVARLKALGVYDDTVVVVLGDHGEELFENGYLGHGQVSNRLQTQIPLVFSPAGIALPRPVGLTDLRALILASAGAKLPAVRRRAAVFQYIGTLDRPSSIAMVEPGGIWTWLDLQTEETWSSDGPQRGFFREVPAGSRLRTRADRLVDLWARERWIQQLSFGK